MDVYIKNLWVDRPNYTAISVTTPFYIEVPRSSGFQTCNPDKRTFIPKYYIQINCCACLFRLICKFIMIFYRRHEMLGLNVPKEMLPIFKSFYGVFLVAVLYVCKMGLTRNFVVLKFCSSCDRDTKCPMLCFTFCHCSFESPPPPQPGHMTPYTLPIKGAWHDPWLPPTLHSIQVQTWKYIK